MMGLVIVVSAIFGYYSYLVNQLEPVELDPLAFMELTYVDVGEAGSNCYVKVPASVEGDLADMGVYKWLAACQERYGDN